MPKTRPHASASQPAEAGPSNRRQSTQSRASSKSRKSRDVRQRRSKQTASTTTPPPVPVPTTAPPPVSTATANLNAAAAITAAAAALSSRSRQPLTGEQSTEWLSQIIAETWPYASSIAETVFKCYIEPAITANMPAIFPQLRFTKIQLGSRPPRVESVNVIPTTENRTDLVSVECVLSFDGDPHIELSVGVPPASITCGVTNMSFRGRVELLVRPLLKRLPLIGATQFAFVNPPQIDYNLTGAARWADIELFRRTFRRVTQQVVAALCVLPNRVSFRVDPRLDFLAFCARPIGVLRVAVLSGSGFPNTDDNALLWRKHLAAPDVYITLQHGGVVKESKRVDDSCDPVYQNQVFDFVLTSRTPEQKLIIHAWDYDMGKQDELLGVAHVNATEIVGPEPYVVHLQDAPHNATPTVTFMARWLELSSDIARVQTAILTQRAETNRPPECSRLLLTINISEACNLPPCTRPFVRATVGDSVKFETWTAFQAADENESPGDGVMENARFEVSHSKLLGEKISYDSKVEFFVIDQRTNKVLGNAFAMLSDFVFRRPLDGAYHFALLNCARPDSSLKASISLEAVVGDSPPLWKTVQQLYDTRINQRE